MVVSINIIVGSMIVLKEITIEELMEFYLDTLKNCGKFLLKENDETIEHYLFEESSEELIDLMILLRKAISENKYVIHYGV